MKKQPSIKAYVIIRPDYRPVCRIKKIKDNFIYIDYPVEEPVVSKKLVLDIISTDDEFYIRGLVVNVIGGRGPRALSPLFKRIKARFGLLDVVQKIEIERLREML